MIHKGITTLNQRSPAQRSATRKGKVLCLAVGVIISLMVFPYTFQPFVLLWVTPAANRNSYRVAKLVGQLPRVAVFARNPGLGNRNSYRVAAACGLSICIIPHVAAACGFLVCIIPHVAAACGLLVCIIPHVAAACGFLVCIIPHIAAACGLLICIIPT